jgi:hypothetical protein
LVTGGVVIALTIMKDITLEEFIGGPALFEGAAGKAAHFHRCCYAQIYSEDISDSGDLNQDVVSKIFGPYIDLWRFTASKKHWSLHAAYLARLVTHINPLICAVWSAPVMELFYSLHFDQVLSTLSTEDYETFIKGSSGTFLNSFLDDAALPKPHGEVHLYRQGVLHLLPLLNTWYIFIPIRHPGNIKYCPAQALYRSQLYFLCLGVVEITRSVAAKMQLASSVTDTCRYTWLQECISASERVIIDCGLRDQINSTKEKVRLQVSKVYW